MSSDFNKTILSDAFLPLNSLTVFWITQDCIQGFVIAFCDLLNYKSSVVHQELGRFAQTKTYLDHRRALYQRRTRRHNTIPRSRKITALSISPYSTETRISYLAQIFTDLYDTRIFGFPVVHSISDKLFHHAIVRNRTNHD